METKGYRSSLRAALEVLLLALLLDRLLRLFDPYGAAANPFNSDMGILVGMARDGYWSPFSLYFYGQDRIGGWPYWLCGWLGAVAGVPVDARWIHTVTFVALVASLALVLRAARIPVVAGLSMFCLLELAGDPKLVPCLFDICHPCAWPLVCLLTFLALHFGLLHDAAGGVRPVAVAVGIAVATLGVWALRSLVVPMMAIPIGFYGMEWRAGATRARRTRYLAQVVAVLVAVAVEQFLRLAQLEYGIAAGFAIFLTPLRFEPMFLDLDILAMMKQVFGIAGICLVAGSLVVVRSRHNRAPGGLPVALLALGLLYVVAVALSGWPRQNQDSPRYVSFSYALFTVALSAALAPHLGRPVLVGLLVAGLCAPVPMAESPDTAELRRHARLLEQHFPGTPIVGVYWGTYVYPALQNERPLVPVLLAGSHQKTPWNFRALHHADRVLVSRRAAPSIGHTVRVRGFVLEQERLEAIPGKDVPVSLYRVTRRP